MTTSEPSNRRLLPVDDDRDTAGYWEAARRHELAISVCGTCGAPLHLPRAYCSRCNSWNAIWKTVTGRGHVYSWTTVEHQVHPAYPVPYTIVLVELDDMPGVRLVGHLPGTAPVTEGQAMQVWFMPVDDDVVLPQWEPVLSGRSIDEETT